MGRTARSHGSASRYWNSGRFLWANFDAFERKLNLLIHRSGHQLDEYLPCLGRNISSKSYWKGPASEFLAKMLRPEQSNVNHKTFGRTICKAQTYRRGFLGLKGIQFRQVQLPVGKFKQIWHTVLRRFRWSPINSDYQSRNLFYEGGHRSFWQK